jgi:AcrR family transcriptional regulator
VSTISAKGTRLNKRGLETRRTLLDAAIRCLAEGGADSVSANRVAREAGVTWGTVQHQFGDVDGMWAAVLTEVSSHGLFVDRPPVEPDPAARVVEVVELLWDAMGTAYARAVFNLRSALPHNRETLEAEFPLTAAAIEAWDRTFTEVCERAFCGMGVDPVRLRRAKEMLPGTLRGLQVEQQLGTYTDVDEARRGFADALVAYVTPTSG